MKSWTSNTYRMDQGRLSGKGFLTRWRMRARQTRLVCAVAACGWGVADGATFHEDVSPVLIRHCATCHHGTELAPFPLLTVGDARKHIREVVSVTERRFMPPWPPAPGPDVLDGERRLSDAEIAVFRRWRDEGMPEGDPAKAPEQPSWTGDWQLGPPDLVIRMPQAYQVPANGKDVYRNFVIPLSAGPRRYVSAWQFRPHSRAVHHMFLCLDRSGTGRRRDGQDAEPGFPGMDLPAGIELPPGHFASWQPGAGARRMRPGTGWALEPGTEIVLQVHLQPLGRPELVQAEVGFYFTDQKPALHPVKLALIHYGIDIPPGVTNHIVSDDFVLPSPARLLGVLPHSHYLCRRIEGRALFPDGTGRTFFLIPDWDFNWQGDYSFRNPPLFPAGTRMTMEMTFDNSEGNPRNPSHPPRRVGYGVNTTDEMAELWMQFLPEGAEADAAFRRAVAERGLRNSQAANEQRLKIDPKDARAMVNLGRVLMAQGRRDEARRRFEEALRTDATIDDAHYNLGLIHRVSGQRDEAIRAFRRTVELNPSHVRAYGNLGLVQVEGDDIEGAALSFEKAIQLDPNDPIALSTLASIRLYQGRVTEAVDYLGAAVRLVPDDADLRRQWEQARARQGAMQK